LLQLEQSLPKTAPIVPSYYQQQIPHWLSSKLAGFGMLPECFESKMLRLGSLRMYFFLHGPKPVGGIGQL
tara:strand:+ start:12 stop:221 length:210 start_codon:yes stop_codon:yes gene_type:complete